MRRIYFLDRRRGLPTCRRADVGEVAYFTLRLSAALDEACKDAIHGCAFIPATSEGRPLSGTTDVAIDWCLPRV